MSTNDDQVSVKITADSTEVKAGMGQAHDATKQALDAMTAALNSMSANFEKQTKVITESLAGVEKQVKKTGDEAKSSFDRMLGTLNGFAKSAQSSLAQVAETFEKVKGALVAFAAVAAGGAALKKVINDTNDWNQSAGKLSKQLGITTESASVYMVALHKLGIESDTLGNAALKVSQQIMKGGQGFEEMRFKVRNAGESGFRPTMDIIEGTVAKIKAIHDPILQNQAGLSAFGKAWGDMKPLMKLTAEGMEEAKEKAEQLGLVVGKDGVTASKEYKENMREVGLALEALEINLGNGLLPAFKDMTAAMSTVAANLVGVLRPAFAVIASAVETVVDINRVLINDMKGILTTTVQALGDVFNAIFGTDIPKDIDIVGNSVKVIQVAFTLAAVAIEESAEGISAVIESIVKVAVTAANIIDRALHGDWDGVKAAWNKGGQDIEDVMLKHAENIVKIQADAKKKIDEIIFGKPAKTSKAGEQDTDPNYDFGKGSKDKQDPGRTPAWEAGLAAKKDALERQAAVEGHFREMSKQEEADYWAGILQRTDLTTNEKLAVQKKYYALEAQVRKEAFEAQLTELEASKNAMGKNYADRIGVAQQAALRIAEAYGVESKEAKKAYADILKEVQSFEDQRSKIEQQHAEAKQKRNEADVDSQQRIAMIEAEAYGASAQEKIKIEQQYLDKRYALDMQDMERRLATVDKDRNPEEYQKLLDQKLAMEAQYHNKVRELDAQFAAANPMTTVFNDMQTSFATAITNMITHAQTLRQSLAAIFGSVLQSFAQQMIAQPLAMMAMRAIRETAIYQAMFAQKKTMEVADAAQQVATQKMAGIAGITSNAALAATAAMASVAAIPVVGWAMAPEVGLETYATAMAYLPSAEGGFDIPAGVNPLTQLHEKEMVLPAEHAETIRNMGGGGGGDTHVHVHALDVRDFEAFLRRGGADKMVSALKERSRNGVRA